MRYIDRLSLRLPAFFISPELVSMRQPLLRLFEQSQGSDEKRAQSFVERSQGRMEEMLGKELGEAFHQTCVYCGSIGPGGPYRFRPETEAEPVQDRSASHLFYCWLATSWDNWLWVCRACRPGNEAFFPVAGTRAALPDLQSLRAFCLLGAIDQGQLAARYRRVTGPFPSLPPSWSDLTSPDSRAAEANLLLDPCTDRELWRDVAVSHDWRLVGLTPRGVETIAHFNLNRRELVEERRIAFKGVETRLDGKIEVDDFGKSTPYFGAIQLRLQFLTGYIARMMGRQVRLDWPDLIKSYNKLQSEPDWRRAYLEAMAATPGQPKATKKELSEPVSAAVKVAPRLVTFAIENFKSLERLSFAVPERARQGSSREQTDAAGALLILGENATGKSSILEAAALCLVDEKTRETLRQRPRLKSKLEHRKLVLDPRFMDPAYRGGPDEARLTATFADGSTRVMVIDKKGLRTSDTPADPDSAEAPEGAPVFAYGAFRQYLEDSPKRLPADHDIATLFESDRLLPNPTAWLLSLEQGRFEMVARSLSVIFAVAEDVEVIRRVGDECHVLTRYEFNGEKRDESAPLDMVSSGFRAILAMACDIMRGLMEGRHARNFESIINARAVVLIDEIEAHLHPRWKLAIMASLRKAMPNVTFIVTSHDPLCLRGMTNGEVMVLNRVRGEQSPDSDLPVFIESLSTLPNIEYLTIEQLLTADFFQLNSTASLESDRRYAQLGDILRRQRDVEAGRPLKPDEKRPDEHEKEIVERFRAEIGNALPVGDTEVQRLVQDAVADYLKERATTTREGLAGLRTGTRERILNALRSV